LVCVKQEGKQQHGRYCGDENIRAGHGVSVHVFTSVAIARKIIAIVIMLFGTRNSKWRNVQQPKRCTQFVIYTCIIFEPLETKRNPSYLTNWNTNFLRKK
jgi:hypothetical protein